MDNRYLIAPVGTFHGGIYPDDHKDETATLPIQLAPLPEKLYIPLQQHQGHTGTLMVQVGDYVKKGQPLTYSDEMMALPVHASSSGYIEAIQQQTVPGPKTPILSPCIVLRTDGLDAAYAHACDAMPLFQQYRQHTLIERIHAAGIAGLGGAGFPSVAKYRENQHIQTIIVNAVECEPYITADDRLMQEYAADIIAGCQILQFLYQATRVIIAITEHQSAALHQLCAALNEQQHIYICRLPHKYPSGSERQLIALITGHEIPHQGRPHELGIIVHNVATVFAIKQAVVDGYPLISRVVTLAGDGLITPGNIWARIGTPIAFLLAYAGMKQPQNASVTIGGPLMGYGWQQLSAPITKTTNCLLVRATPATTAPQEYPCIRCQRCMNVCPAQLLPQQLYWFSRAKAYEKAQQAHLFDCIECGACSYVCPSHIPLVQYYQQAKSAIYIQQQQREDAQEAKQRFLAKQQRIAQEKQAREARHQALLAKAPKFATTAITEDPPVNSTLTENSGIPSTGVFQPDQHRIAALEAIARAKARKAYAVGATDASSESSTETQRSDTMANQSPKKSDQRPK